MNGPVKKTIATLIAALMIAGACTGCGETASSAPSGPVQTQHTNAPTIDESVEIDFDKISYSLFMGRDVNRGMCGKWSLTNDTGIDLTEAEMRWMLKSNLTEEEQTIVNSCLLSEENVADILNLTDEESELLAGYLKTIQSMGFATASIYDTIENGATAENFILVYSMLGAIMDERVLSLMEPSILEVGYMGSDNIEHQATYDFLTGDVTGD